MPWSNHLTQFNWLLKLCAYLRICGITAQEVSLFNESQLHVWCQDRFALANLISTGAVALQVLLDKTFK